MGADFQCNVCQGTPTNLGHTSGSAVSPYLPGSVARDTAGNVTTCQAKVRDSFQRVALLPLLLARLRFCVHYCIDRDAVNKAVREKKRASRDFFIRLSTKKFKKIWKQDNQTNVLDLTLQTLTTHTHTHTQTDT